MVLLTRLLLAGTVLLVVPGLFEGFEAPKAAFLRLVGVVALAIAAFAARRRWRLSVLDLAVFAWFCTEVLTTVCSVSPRLSLVGEPLERDGLLTSLGLVGAYLAARAHPDERARGRTLDVFLGALSLSCVYAMLQSAQLDPLRWGQGATYGPGGLWLRPFGTLGHPNLLGVMSSAAVCMAAARAVLEPARRWLWLPLTLLFAVTTVLTFSRGAWLGMAAGLAVCAALLAARGGLRLRRRWLVAAVVGIGVLVALFIAGGWAPFFGSRVAESATASAGTGRTRLEIWRASIAAWQARPWLGYGPDTFATVFPRFQTPEYWRFEWGGLPYHAHSIVFNTFATRGVAGMLTLAALAVACLWAALTAWRQRGVARDYGVVAVPALVALVVSGQFGELGVAGGACAACMAAWLVCEPLAPATKLRRGERIAVAVVALGALAWTLNMTAAERAVGSSRAHQERNARLAVADARAAVARAPWEDVFHMRHVESALVASGQDAPRAAQWLAEAEAAAREAVRLAPQKSQNRERLALVYAWEARIGVPAAADSMAVGFDRALVLAPQSGLLLIERASLATSLGQHGVALAAARRALELYPAQPETRAALAAAERAAAAFIAQRGAPAPR